jgi:hypothetical protein
MVISLNASGTGGSRQIRGSDRQSNSLAAELGGEVGAIRPYEGPEFRTNGESPKEILLLQRFEDLTVEFRAQINVTFRTVGEAETDLVLAQLFCVHHPRYHFDYSSGDICLAGRPDWPIPSLQATHPCADQAIRGRDVAPDYGMR